MYWYYLDRTDLRYPKEDTLIHIADLQAGTVQTGKFTKEEIDNILAQNPERDYAWIHVYIPPIPKKYVINRPAFCNAGHRRCDFFDDGYCTGFDEKDGCPHRIFRRGILTSKYWGE